MTVKSSEDKLREAIWQYLIDHSTVNQSGNHVVTLYIKNKGEFWWRVKQRELGTYKRVILLEAEDRAEWLQSVARSKGFVERMDVVEYEINKRGSCKDKIVLYCYKKLREYLKNYK